jgi:2-polyprenyl-3-methyl-5-hydroxy-6-metoxy-1,4-benzoquinol methylase
MRREITVLDIGGGESRLAKTLAELGFTVTIIDIGNVDCGKATHVKNNILDYEFPEGTFDIIISISTIEHVGLQCYGQTRLDNDGDIKVMDKIYRWLKPRGLAIITLPYGKPHHPPSFERVYNPDSLKKRILSNCWYILRMEYICKDEAWRPCQELETKNHDSAVLLLLQKTQCITNSSQ